MGDCSAAAAPADVPCTSTKLVSFVSMTGGANSDFEHLVQTREWWTPTGETVGLYATSWHRSCRMGLLQIMVPGWTALVIRFDVTTVLKAVLLESPTIVSWQQRGRNSSDLRQVRNAGCRSCSAACSSASRC